MQRNKPNSLVRIQTKEDDARDRANDVNGLTVVTKYSQKSGLNETQKKDLAFHKANKSRLDPIVRRLEGWLRKGCATSDEQNNINRELRKFDWPLRAANQSIKNAPRGGPISPRGGTDYSNYTQQSKAPGCS